MWDLVTEGAEGEPDDKSSQLISKKRYADRGCSTFQQLTPNLFAPRSLNGSMAQYNNVHGLPEYDNILGEQALGDDFWTTGDVVYRLIRLRAYDAYG
jgi:hypothetical protein